ncbi:hypothetical protein [Paenibacillus sp. NPDC058071]|uniref:hypothetical protein n=1 Tax=Paenibacillus sp. NPDC058071 TaxID=3346326 RepID=UPI0036D87597
MSNTRRWKDIMDFYYSDLNSNFLKSDLQSAGFTIEGEDNLKDQQTALEDLNLSVKEVAAAYDSTPKTLPIYIDKKGRHYEILIKPPLKG